MMLQAFRSSLLSIRINIAEWFTYLDNLEPRFDSLASSSHVYLDVQNKALFPAIPNLQGLSESGPG